MTRPLAVLLLLLLVSLTAGRLAADSLPATASTVSSVSAASASSTPPPASANVALSAASSTAVPPAAAAVDADAATKRWLDRLSPEARAKSDAYFEGGYWLLLWDFLLGLGVAWLYLGLGWSRKIRDAAERLTRFTFLRTAIVAAAYLFLTTIVQLPWNAWEGWAREHNYGMSNQTLADWLGEQGKGLAISLVIGTLAITAIYAVLRRAPRTWWLWGAVVSVAILMVVVAVAPVFLEPAFNHFTPLPPSPLKSQILSMAHANGIPADDVWGFDASKQTKRMSAHVSGLLGTTRISLNDNLMNRGSSEEIRAVLGHEIGHYVLNHVYKGMVFLGLVVVAGFAFLRWSFDRVRTGIGAGWGIHDIGDIAGLPLLVALFSVYSFVLTPIENSVTRTMEAEADAFGLNAARQPDGFAEAALHLSEYRKMTPGPVEEWLFYDHPSGWNRIHRAMVWKSEHLADADIAAHDAAHPDDAAALRPK